MLLLLRRPHEFFEQQQELLAAAAAAGGGDAAVAAEPPQFSLLALCALRQALRMLPSAKIAAEDKAAVAAYVAGVLRALAQQQLGPAAAASLAAVLLGVAKAEAERQQQQQQQQQQEKLPAGQPANGKQGKKEKKRKQVPADGGAAAAAEGAAAAALSALPPEGLSALLPEGGPLSELLSILERRAGQEGVDGQKASKKRRKSGLGNGGGFGAADLTGPATSDLGASLLLIDQLACGGGNGGDSARLLAALQQRLSGGAAGTCAAVLRRCLHWLGQPAAAEPLPAALQALRAALAAARGSGAEERRCLRLLAGSGLVAAALAGDAASGEAEQALAAAVAAHLLDTLQRAPAGGGLSPDCQPLLERAAAAFRRRVLHHAGADAEQRGGDVGDALPPAVRRFLLLLPVMPAAAVEEVAGLLLETLSPCGKDGSSSSSSKKKTRKGEAAAGTASPPSWLSTAAATVLGRHLDAAGSQPALRGGQLKAACGLLLRLADASSDAALAAVAACFQQLLQGPQQEAALAALQEDGQARLLRRCLAAPAAAGDASLAARSQLAARLISGSATCRQAAAADLLPALLGGGGGLAGLALALQPAIACLEQQAQQAGSDDAAAEAEAELAAALGEKLLSLFAGVPGGPERAVEEAEQRKQKKKKRRVSDGGEPAAACDGQADAAARQLLQRHALPCLRLTLQRRPLSTARRQQLLAQLLPERGWQGAAPGGAAGGSSCEAAALQPGAADTAEAAVLLLCSGSGPSVSELATCVRCFAATLAALLRRAPQRVPPLTLPPVACLVAAGSLTSQPAARGGCMPCHRLSAKSVNLRFIPAADSLRGLRPRRPACWRCWTAPSATPWRRCPPRSAPAAPLRSWRAPPPASWAPPCCGTAWQLLPGATTAAAAGVALRQSGRGWRLCGCCAASWRLCSLRRRRRGKGRGARRPAAMPAAATAREAAAATARRRRASRGSPGSAASAARRWPARRCSWCSACWPTAASCPRCAAPPPPARRRCRPPRRAWRARCPRCCRWPRRRMTPRQLSRQAGGAAPPS
jgi:hypothetical protein